MPKGFITQFSHDEAKKIYALTLDNDRENKYNESVFSPETVKMIEEFRETGQKIDYHLSGGKMKIKNSPAFFVRNEEGQWEDYKGKRVIGIPLKQVETDYISLKEPDESQQKGQTRTFHARRLTAEDLADFTLAAEKKQYVRVMGGNEGQGKGAGCAMVLLLPHKASMKNANGSMSLFLNDNQGIGGISYAVDYMKRNADQECVISIMPDKTFTFEPNVADFSPHHISPEISSAKSETHIFKDKTGTMTCILSDTTNSISTMLKEAEKTKQPFSLDVDANSFQVRSLLPQMLEEGKWDEIDEVPLCPDQGDWDAFGIIRQDVIIENSRSPVLYQKIRQRFSEEMEEIPHDAELSLRHDPQASRAHIQYGSGDPVGSLDVSSEARKKDDLADLAAEYMLENGYIYMPPHDREKIKDDWETAKQKKGVLHYKRDEDGSIYVNVLTREKYESYYPPPKKAIMFKTEREEGKIQLANMKHFFSVEDYEKLVLQGESDDRLSLVVDPQSITIGGTTDDAMKSSFGDMAREGAITGQNLIIESMPGERMLRVSELEPRMRKPNASEWVPLPAGGADRKKAEGWPVEQKGDDGSLDGSGFFQMSSDSMSNSLTAYYIPLGKKEEVTKFQALLDRASKDRKPLALFETDNGAVKAEMKSGWVESWADKGPDDDAWTKRDIIPEEWEAKKIMSPLESPLALSHRKVDKESQGRGNAKFSR